MDHFQHKSPLAHVMERRAAGILELSEAHGTEIPGQFSAAADALRETGFLICLLWTPIYLWHAPSPLPRSVILPLLVGCGLGLVIWKTGRSAWLGWARLERLHRILREESKEIEENRPQEREELKALYAAKGLEGKLLEDVLDVLMADNDRLLKIMLEEELGLTLQAYEHPLKQASGALLGTLFVILLASVLYLFSPSYGIYIAALIAVSAGACLSALYEKNRFIPALVWNLSIAIFALGTGYFLLGMWL